jgi:hypothetical protein
MTVDGGHFVVCDKVDSSGYRIFDQGRLYVLSAQQLETKWSGESLVLSDQVIRHEGPNIFLNYTLAAAGLLAIVWLAMQVTKRLQNRKLRKILVFSILCVLGVGCGSEGYQVGGSRPHSSGLVVVGDPEVELGLIAPGDDITVTTFILKNEGLEPIRIEHIRTSCSCAFAQASDEQVFPGQLCEIKVHIDPSKAMAGEATIAVKSMYNTLKLSVNWKVGGPIHSPSKELPILYVDSGGVAENEIVLSGDGIDSASVVSVSDQKGLFVHQATISNGKCKLQVNVPETVPEGVYYGYLQLSTRLPNTMPLVIPWTVRVITPISVSPRKVRFFRKGTDLWESLIVVDRVTTKLEDELLVSSVPSELLSLSVERTVSGDGWIAKIQINDRDYADLKAICFSVDGSIPYQVAIHK